MIELVASNTNSDPIGIIVTILGISAIIFMALLIFLLITQYLKASNEDFSSPGRNVFLGVLACTLVFSTLMGGSLGKKIKSSFQNKSRVMMAFNVENANCIEGIALKSNGRYSWSSACDRSKGARGKFTMESDTIKFHDIKLKNKTSSCYKFAIVQEDTLLMFDSSTDSNPEKYAININNIKAYLKKE